jgi:hypothetical protein
MEAGGGVGGGVAVLGQLADLWRRVYRTAAAAAEARARELLAAHVYERHGQRAVAVVLDGGGAVLTPGVKCDLELPWAYVLEGWALYAGLPAAGGALELDLLVADTPAAFPSFASIVGGSTPPALDAVDAPLMARDVELTDWAVAHPRGRVLRVAVVSAEAITLATLTLFVRAV